VLTAEPEGVSQKPNVVGRRFGFRFSFLPPLMVYFAAGVSGLTTLAGTFVVKEHLALSAKFLAALGFWVALPWALKIPTGHLVDLLWKFRSVLVFFGATLIAASLLIIVGLLADRELMTSFASAETWYVISSLCGPTGYMLQDAVADAMTVEAIPKVDDRGAEIDVATQMEMHSSMQLLGRVVLVIGNLAIGFINLAMFKGVDQMTAAEKTEIYTNLYLMALVIPAVSVGGVVLEAVLRFRRRKKMILYGVNPEVAAASVERSGDRTPVNWLIVWGGLGFTVVSLAIGLSNMPASQECVFLLSFGIVVVLMRNLLRSLSPEKRFGIVGTAVVIFIFRAMPGPGVGPTWWMIDVLRFDQHFLAVLDLTASTVTLVAMFALRRTIAKRPIVQVVGTLTVLITVLTLPNLGLFYGLHNWTAARTGGVVDAKFITLVDTALDSPLMQIVWVPMLAWVARSAPDNLKATYFAVFTTFINLARSASQLGTKYLNELYTVTREIRDRSSGAITVPQDYSQLGHLLLATIILGVVAPLTAIIVLKVFRLKTN
jgi:hypothetical protein